MKPVLPLLLLAAVSAMARPALHQMAASLPDIAGPIPSGKHLDWREPQSEASAVSGGPGPSGRDDRDSTPQAPLIKPTPARASTAARKTDGAAPVSLEITDFAGDVVLGWEQVAPHGGRHPRRFHPRELVGLNWSTPICVEADCETVNYRIAAVNRDTSTNTMPGYSENSDVWLYQVEYSLASNPHRWQNLCDQGASDETGGIFVNGRWHEDGTWEPDGWSFSCRSGVISKCARAWGYKPWKSVTAPSGEMVDLRPLHQACTRAARADYCGDGIPHTRNGTPVDMFDVYGLNRREDVPGFASESAFGTDGALWVQRPRWPAGTSTEHGWRFETCELPREQEEVAQALVYIRSDPLNGRRRY